MPEVINVKFRNKGKAYFFDPAGTAPVLGDSVIVETAKGIEYGECVRGIHYVEEAAIVPPLRPVIRVATEEDKAVFQANKEKEKTAFEFCQKKIAERGLEMKLVDVEYSFDNSKILFFFTSGGRVDFRELVKDLAGVFRTRIELRQIGVRDSAKLVGGLGICGRPFCCSVFLDDFQPVSIKMAKTQSLSLNPTKISGTCGRLMCCLKYEQDAYEHLLKTVPKLETEVDTPDGKGVVKEVNLLRRTVKVKLAEENITELKTYAARELGFTVGGAYKEPEPPEELPEDMPENGHFRYNFRNFDPLPALINDKMAVDVQDKDEEACETSRNRKRGGKRHKNRKPQNAQRVETVQNELVKAEQPKTELPKKAENQPRAERQGQKPGNKHKPNSNKNQQPRPQEKQERAEKLEKQDNARSKNRHYRGEKPHTTAGRQHPEQGKADASKKVMDEKAKARAAAVAEAVAQARPNANKRHHYHRHKNNKTE